MSRRRCIMKKIISSFLVLLMLFSFIGGTFAEAAENRLTDKELLNLDISELELTDDVLMYIDTINPDFDLATLLKQEEEISFEQSLLEQPEHIINEFEIQRNPVVIAALLRTVAQLIKKYGVPAYHLAQRMHERGISAAQVYNAITKGKKYHDPDHNSTVYHFGGVAVGKKGGTFTTTYKQKNPKTRWRPL
ncbi:hypothetical protein CN617_01665 [Bacillus wiedmannii]|nr:hypothetical protein CN617_01665 [Bacillus wiedmannii]